MSESVSEPLSEVLTLSESVSEVSENLVSVSESVSEVSKNFVSESESASDTDSDTSSCPNSCPCPPNSTTHPIPSQGQVKKIDENKDINMFCKMWTMNLQKTCNDLSIINRKAVNPNQFFYITRW